MRPYLISTAVPTPKQYLLAIGLILVLLAALGATAPFARTPLIGTEPIVPAYAAAILLIELTTSALLLGVFSVERSRAALVLAAGYAFSGALVVPWALTFPGVFGSLGLDVGLQNTAAIAAIRRVGFPLFILAYALLKHDADAEERPLAAVARPILLTAAAVCAGVIGVSWLFLSNPETLPAFMRNPRQVTALWYYVPAVVIPLYCVILYILWTRLRSVLDL
jgi:hypothetical protein